MFGFLIGTLSLIALFKVTRGGWGGHRGGRGWNRWGRGGWILRGLYQRLDTTPGQEKVIAESFDAVRAAASKFRGEADRLRRDVAQAIRGQTLDHEPLKAAFGRHDTLVEELQREVLVSLGKVHEALDERQRRELAELIESGGYGFGACGGYRRCGPGRWDDRYAAQSI